MATAKINKEQLAKDIMTIHMQTMIAFWRIYDGGVVTSEEFEDTQSWQDFYYKSQGWEIRMWDKLSENRN